MVGVLYFELSWGMVVPRFSFISLAVNLNYVGFKLYMSFIWNIAPGLFVSMF